MPDQLGLLDDALRAQALLTAPEPGREAPRTALERFDERVAATPDAPALRAGGTRLSYAELACRVELAAADLRRHGVRPGSTVGVLLERGTDLVVAILAVWRAGGCYVPLDPMHPDARLRLVLDDSAAGIVVSSPDLAIRVAGSDIPVLYDLGRSGEAGPDGTGAPAPGPRDLAVLIYTSGTTGLPKGVALEHGNLAAYVAAELDPLPLDAAPTVGLTAAVSFDVSYIQLLHLTRGACLVVADDATYRNPQALVAWVRDEDVRFLDLTPSMLALMREFGLDELLRERPIRLELAGEAVNTATWTGLRELGVSATNAYGPTEAGIVTTAALAETDRPTIGRPVAGTTVYVLSPDLEPLPPGAAGDLWIGGPQVARGYLNAPRLTAESFLPDPFSTRPGARMYRTGDRVRIRPDGLLDYLERADDQLKVRGQRVDPYEVENALRAQPAVADAYVARRAAVGAHGLRAYLRIADGERLDPDALRSALAGLLAPAAVPNAFVEVDRFPLTASGKIDEAALPRPDSRAPRDDRPGAPLDGPVPEQWERAVGTRPHSADEDFFGVGGTSIEATRLVAALSTAHGVDLDLAAFFATPTPRGLQHSLDAALAAAATADAAAGATDRAPALSAAQRRLWLMHRMDPRSFEFTVPWALRVAGPLDTDALATAWRAVLAAHDELRLRIGERDGEPTRDLWPVERMELRTRSVPADALDDELEKLVTRVFDLFAEPLAGLEVLRLAEDDHVLLFAAHHIVNDGRSIQIVTDELFRRYAGTPVVPSAMAYDDYLAREGRGAGVDGDGFRDWAEEFRLPPVEQPLGMGETRSDRSWRGDSLRLPLDPQVWQSVRGTAREHRTTPLVFALSALATTLARYAGSADMVLGASMDTRPNGFADTVGMFVNPAPVRLRSEPGQSAADLVAATRRALLRTHAHRDVPFDELVRHLGVTPDPSRTPLFQVLLNHEPFQALPAVPGLRIADLPLATKVSKYDLTVTLQERADGADLVAVYRTDRYGPEQIGRFMAHLRTILTGFAAQGADCADAVAMLSPEETEGLLAAGRGAALPADHTPVHLLVEETARRTPDRPAVAGSEVTYSYGELHDRAGRVAERLAAAGVVPGTRVGVLVERSALAAAVVLGVLRAGCAYVPLDPSSPDARIDSVLSDAEVAAVVTTGGLAHRIRAGLPVVRADELPDGPAEFSTVQVAGHDPAYIIYTSGSTGEPKGVVVEHAQLAASTLARRETYPGEPVFLLLSSLAFDSSVAGLWGTLTAGGLLVIASTDEIRDPARLLALVDRHQVTDLLCVPSLYEVLLTAAERGTGAGLRSVRRVIVAGEPLPDALLQRQFDLAAPAEVVNEYGPTEATVWSSFRRYGKVGPVDIGGPVPGARLYVLDDRQRLVAPGVAGELYVGGAGVSRGYLGRPVETACSFLPDPFSGEWGARMFRTGDRVRWSAEGRLEFLGRRDNQVKVRGHRIELGAVEAALRACHGVRDAAVVADTRGATQLVAFVTAERGLDLAAVRRELGEQLPEPMVPAVLRRLDAFPVNANGKVDRAELGRLAEREDADGGAGTAEGDTTALVSAAWAEVLGVASVPAEVNFFDVGGHSLLVPALQVALQRRTGVEVAVLDLFRFTTVMAQAGLLEEAAAVAEAAVRSEDAVPLVSAAWAEVLGVASVPAEVNFFDVGGHSLLVPALQVALQRRTGVEVAVLDLFRFTTVMAQAGLLEEAAAADAPQSSAEEDDRERRARVQQARRRRAGGGAA
ncbi:amino acid adenylation domain-containing protein [Streptomyces sp. NPDC048506]|uniref:amino acid adenylation domain-containing protein n=1 Tax=Streptomyces sp. NPDC048506 TaxID=3155028 RepID=UPI00342D0CF9